MSEAPGDLSPWGFCVSGLLALDPRAFDPFSSSPLGKKPMLCATYGVMMRSNRSPLEAPRPQGLRLLDPFEGFALGVMGT